MPSLARVLTAVMGFSAECFNRGLVNKGKRTFCLVNMVSLVAKISSKLPSTYHSVDLHNNSQEPATYLQKTDKKKLDKKAFGIFAILSATE